MTILFITEFFPDEETLKFSGGVEAYSFYLVKELAKKNQVKVIYRSFSNSKGKHFLEVANPNLKIVKINTGSHIEANLSSIPERIMFFTKSIKMGLNENFDIVQGTNFVTYISAFLVGFVKNKPKVAWYPDVFVGKWISLFGLGAGVVGETCERISLILPWSYFVALSKSTKSKLLKRGIDSRKIRTIYAGIDYDFFSEVRASKEKVFTICTISRLVEYKRVDLLIKAVKILSDEGYTLSLKIIGEGGERRNLVKLATNLGISRKIRWLSRLDRVSLAKQLISSHLFCLCSEEEGFGMVVVEAACCKLPYIISSIPVLSEITDSARGGLIFESGNEYDLALKIKDLIDNPKKVMKLSKEGLQLAKKYSWGSIARQFSEVYEKCAKG